MEKELKLDALLQRQDEEQAAFAVTVERVEDDDAKVKITPYIHGECMCSYALTIPKRSVKSVTPTGATHECCGKSLTVVRIHFADEATIHLNDLYEQIGAAISKSSVGGSQTASSPIYYVVGNSPYEFYPASYQGASPFFSCPPGQIRMVCGGVEQCGPPGSRCCGTSHCLPDEECRPIKSTPGGFECVKRRR